MNQHTNNNQMFSYSNQGIFSSPSTTSGFVGMMCSNNDGGTPNTSGQGLSAVDPQQAYNAMQQTMSDHSGKFNSQVAKLHQLIQIQEHITGKNPLTGQETGVGTHAHLFKESNDTKVEETVEWSGGSGRFATDIGSASSESIGQRNNAETSQRRKVKKEDDQFEIHLEQLLDSEARLAGPEHVPGFVQLMKKANSINSRRMLLTVITETSSVKLLKKLASNGCLEVLDKWIRQTKLERRAHKSLLVKILNSLIRIPVTVELLQQTKIGKSVAKLQKNQEYKDVTKSAAALIKKWKNTVRSNKRPREEKKEDGPAAKRSRTKESKGMFASVSGSNSEPSKSDIKSESTSTKRRVQPLESTLPRPNKPSTTKPINADDIQKMKRKDKDTLSKESESNNSSNKKPRKKGVHWATDLVKVHEYKPEEEETPQIPVHSRTPQHHFNIPNVAWRTPPRVSIPPNVRRIGNVYTEAAQKEQEREQRTRAVTFVDSRKATGCPDETLASMETSYDDSFVPRIPLEKQSSQSNNENEQDTLYGLVSNPAELTQLLNLMKSDSHQSQSQQPTQQYQQPQPQPQQYQQTSHNNMQTYSHHQRMNHSYYGDSSYGSYNTPSGVPMQSSSSSYPPSYYQPQKHQYHYYSNKEDRRVSRSSADPNITGSIPKKYVRCKYYRGRNSCRKGRDCPFYHEGRDPVPPGGIREPEEAGY